MKNKDTILIIYPTGGYGTFFEWCLTYFSGELIFDSSPIISETGSAHNFWGNPLDFPSFPKRNLKSLTMEEYLNSDLNFTFARSHANFFTGLQDYVNRYGPAFKHIIELRPDHTVILEIMLNLFHKIVREDAKNQLDFEYKLSSITDDDNIWEVREKLSFHLRGRYLHIDLPEHHVVAPNVITIPISQFCTQSKNCILKVFDSVGMPIDPERKLKIDDILADWENNQIFLNIDQKCHDFVDAVIAGKDYSWPELNKLPYNIFIEAYIQMLLRDLHGFEIKCYNLDVFPTNAKDLKELLINV